MDITPPPLSLLDITHLGGSGQGSDGRSEGMCQWGLHNKIERAKGPLTGGEIGVSRKGGGDTGDLGVNAEKMITQLRKRAIGVH